MILQKFRGMFFSCDNRTKKLGRSDADNLAAVARKPTEYDFALEFHSGWINLYTKTHSPIDDFPKIITTLCIWKSAFFLTVDKS